MKKNELSSEILLFLATIIWGFGFVAQRAGMEYIGPFVFNGIRFILGAVVIFPLVFFFVKKNELKKEIIRTLRPSFFSGILLFTASTLQQIAMVKASAGKAAFITGLYVILVPIISIFFGHKTRRNLWIGAVLAILGLYFLTDFRNGSIQISDVLLFLCAIFWALHVLYISKISKKYNAVLIASFQFFYTGIISLILALIFEDFNFPLIHSAGISILYAGIMSVGVAFTLQIFGQKHAHPSHSAIILSLESLFGFIGGILIIHEHPSLTSTIGALLMLTGIIVAQI